MESRKKQILITAASLFREKGYNAVTMRDLAAEMGIKAASLYNHISSKQDILEAIVINIAREFTEGMDAIKGRSGSSIDKLTQIVHLHVELAIKDPNAMSALNSDWMHLKEKLQDYLRMREAYETNFRAIILQGIEAGEIKVKDVDLIVFSMLSTLRSLYLWIPKKQTRELSTFSKDLAEVLISGINR
jgi:AcrR family transcriptional regulator